MPRRQGRETQDPNLETPMYSFLAMTCFLMREYKIPAKKELHRSLQERTQRAPRIEYLPSKNRCEAQPTTAEACVPTSKSDTPQEHGYLKEGPYKAVSLNCGPLVWVSS